jgi:hypothetical protein
MSSKKKHKTKEYVMLLPFVLFNQYCNRNQIERDEVSGASGTLGGGGKTKCIYSFGGETKTKETTWIIQV